jgi:CDGSH-type Zn-finger protein
VQDTAQDVSGPIWVRGGLPVTGADGREYEVRNRMTLCRCGASTNKPFCDGSHVSIGFNDQE